MFLFFAFFVYFIYLLFCTAGVIVLWVLGLIPRAIMFILDKVEERRIMRKENPGASS